MTLWQDLRFAMRMLGKSRAFTSAAVLTLALGIGANTAIFTVANAVLLRPLPYVNPDRLAVLSSTLVADRTQSRGFSWGQYNLLRDRNRSFSAMSAVTAEAFNVTSNGAEPEQVSAGRVSDDFFGLLGVRPRLGRGFLPEEDRAGGQAVAVIGNSLWMRRFAGQPGVLGRNISLDARDYKIVGILPDDFQFPFLGPKVDVWVPRVFDLNFLKPVQIAAGAGFLNAIGRLRPGVTREQAEAEMVVLNRQYQRDNPQKPDADPKRTIDAVLLQDRLVANLRVALLVLLGAVGFVLLIACANVANLLMSRALGRRKEIAIRAALGAARATIIGQLLTESLALSAVSGAAGLLLAWWGTHELATATIANLPKSDFGIDRWVLVFTLGISIATGLLFGLIPALQISRSDVNTVLREEGRGSAGNRRRNFARSGLVIGQVALSLMLLIGSGLLLRSFFQLQQTDPGCDLRNVLTMSLTLPQAKYSTPEQLLSVHDRLLAELGSVPGIQAATLSGAIPLNPIRFTPCNKEGDQAIPLSQRTIVAINPISPEYLRVMSIPLIRGRAFNPHDDLQGAKIMLVNRELARRFWPNQDAIGQKVYIGLRTFPNEVVGVIGDVKNVGLAVDTMPEIYLPMAQLPMASLSVSVRTTADPHQTEQAVRQAIFRVDKDQPVTAMQTMEELESSLNAQPRLTMLLLSAFAATAFLLAIIGIYGVISHSVAQRTQELGIRLALGAKKTDIFRLVIPHGLALAGAGVALGLAGALALTRIMSSLLYRVDANDPRTFVFSALAFTAVALLASYIPARRAVNLDPLTALRCE
jgi:putative ABC transport system permease protein